MNKTILLTNKYTERPLEIIRSNVPDGFSLLMLDSVTQESLDELIPEADYLLASGRLKVNESNLAKAKKIKMIQRTGVGLDCLDLDEIKNRGIPLYVNQGVNSQSVLEHTLLLMMACLRKLTVIDSNTKAGTWRKQEQGTCTHELRGKTIGIVGMGNIAQRLVKVLSVFGVNILYSDINRMPEEFESSYNMRLVGREELFRKSDIITLHCALNEQTRGMINKKTISEMKDGVIIINTARGPMINAVDLADAIRRGKIAFAGIDVHEVEPIPENYPLKGMENVILTPHVAGITYESFNEMMRDAMRNIELFEKGELNLIAQYRYL